MAEHFSGPGHTVHLSNDGAESLLQAWIRIGERLPPAEETEGVLGYLRSCMRRGRGWRAFDFYPPPDELALPQRLRCLAQIIAVFAEELARPSPDPSLTDIEWDRGLRLRWLAQQLDLYDFIGAALPEGAAPLPILDPMRSTSDRIDCTLQRLLGRRYEQRRSRTSDLESNLALTEQILALAAALGPSAEWAEFLVDEYEDKAASLTALGDREGAIVALRTARELTANPDFRLLFDEMAVEVEQSLEQEVMSEAEWLSCEDLFRMLRFLRVRRSKRSFRLFACACARRAWEKLPSHPCRTAVETVEKYADSIASEEELQDARKAAQAFHAEVGFSFLPVTAASLAVLDQDAVAAARQTAIAALAVLVPNGTAHEKMLRSQERRAQGDLLRDIAGPLFRTIRLDPNWLAWNEGTLPRLAHAIYDEHAFERLPILADAFEEAGCTDADILAHCRQPKQHARGCWVIDLLRGKS